MARCGGIAIPPYLTAAGTVHATRRRRRLLALIDDLFIV
jgi:hypothetical protein